MSVDIGTDFDWSESGYEEKRDLSCDGTRWVGKICEENNRAVKDQASAMDNLVIPPQRDGEAYDVENMSNEQQKIVYTAVDTVIKFITNDPGYKPMRATVMGSGGT